MGTLIRLSVLSIVRQRTALVAFIVIPAVLVLLAADALSQFAEVLSPGGSGAHMHSGHFNVLATLWAAGMSAAVVAAITVAESKSADSVLTLKGGSWSWAQARCTSFVAVAAVATAFALLLSAIRGNEVTLSLVVGMLIVSILYVLVGQIVAYFTKSAVTAVGCISGIWIVDAVCAPTMMDDGLLRRLSSPFYSAEQFAMGGAMNVGDWAVLCVWTVVLVVVFRLCYQVRPTLRLPGRKGLVHVEAQPVIGQRPPLPSDTPSGARSSVPGRDLMLVDLWRHRGLLLFVVLGPFALMLSSLWLFQDVEVAVPSVVDGYRTVVSAQMPELHAAYMGMIAVVSFCGTAGYLIGSELLIPDRRLAMSSRKPWLVIMLRLLSLLAVSPVATVGALLLVPLVRQPDDWLWFAGAHLGAGFAFTLFGFCLGLVLDRVAGILVMMFFPFIDVGIAQDYMLGPVLPGWSVYLPSHPFVQICISAAFGGEVFDIGYAFWGAGIVLAAAVAAVGVMARGVRPAYVAAKGGAISSATSAVGRDRPARR